MAKKKTKKKTVKKTSKKPMRKASQKTTKKIQSKSSKKVSKKTTKTAKKKTLKKVQGESLPLAAVSVGALVPDFSLPSSSGSEFFLSGLRGKKVVLYFYPKDATPGCTVEGHEFSRLLGEFHNWNTEVYGISRDSIKSHCQFRDKEGYTVELLSDSEELACRLFGVIKEKNMYGKTVMGIERSTFLIGEDGKLIKEWRKVKAEGHAQEVLDSLKP